MESGGGQVAHIAAVRKRTPQKIVTTLEEILMMAAQGKLQALAIITIDTEGDVTSQAVAHSEEQYDRLSAAAFRLMRQIDDERA